MKMFQFITASVAFLAWLDRAASRTLHQMDCEDDICADMFEKCGGTNMTVSIPCCSPETSCVVKNYFYAQCLTEERAAQNVMNGWDGTILDECSEMPEDVIKGPALLRRRLQAGTYGDMDCDDDTCTDAFAKCAGGYNKAKHCCDPDMQCTIKNWFYAQCLTPERAAINVQMRGWDGRTLTACEDMPTDAEKGPDFWTWETDNTAVSTRRLRHAEALETDCEDDTCVGKFEKCGGAGLNVTLPCCDDGDMCIAKNYWYAQCLPADRVERKVAEQGWDGRVLMCEEMPDDLDPEVSRRLLRVNPAERAGGYGSTMSAIARGKPKKMPKGLGPEKPRHLLRVNPAERAGGYGSEMSAIARSTPKPRFVLGSGCESCAPMFGQCGTAGSTVSCCSAGLQCVKKNKFFAQCITPERAARNVKSLGWDGEVLACGQMMA